MQVFSETFDVVATSGARTDSLVGTNTNNIYSPLKVTFILLEAAGKRLCFVTAPFYCDSYPLSNLLRDRLSAALNIPRDAIAIFSSHNHSCVLLCDIWPFPDGFPQEDLTAREDQLTAEGHAMLDGLLAAAARSAGNMTTVTVAWAVGHERRVSYNRKGRRADGTPYLMRDEDRLLLGEDFNGDIDDDAPVVAFLDAAGKPVCFLTQFTCHPCTAYHPEDPNVFGDFPQVACDDLSAAHGGAPAGFLQGCAGEINSKFFLAPITAPEKVERATYYGHCLGETYVAASKRLTPSRRDSLDYAWERVKLPFASVPSERSLRADLREMDLFLERCAAGDENTRTCVGLNFPTTLSPKYRARLITPCRRWTEWALALHTENRLHEAAKFVEVEMGVFRIGDVGIVGMPVEPFLGIGRQIRAGSKLPLTIPCGYMNDNIAYVQDSPNVGDRDYSSSYYRYTNGFLPFKKPCGDLLARAAVRHLNRMAKDS